LIQSTVIGGTKLLGLKVCFGLKVWDGHFSAISKIGAEAPKLIGQDFRTPIAVGNALATSFEAKTCVEGGIRTPAA
jgi:hypothetical protein